MNSDAHFQKEVLPLPIFVALFLCSKGKNPFKNRSSRFSGHIQVQTIQTPKQTQNNFYGKKPRSFKKEII